jgi:excisionase family DNA binding protein
MSLEIGTALLLTEEEAARLLGVKSRLMRDLRGQKRIGFVRVGRLVRYRREDVERFIEAHEVRAER